MTSQKGVGITPACATFRLPIGYNQLNKQMHSVVYVHNCCDRNVSTPKRPNRNHLDQNGSDRNGLYRNGQTESARTKRPDRIVAKCHTSGVTRAAACPGGESLGGCRKVPAMSQVFSSMQYIYSQKILGSNMEAPNLFLAPDAI